MSEAKHTPVQFGMTVGADFEANTMTLEMEPGYVVAVGPVAVLPRGTYDELLDALKLARDYVNSELLHRMEIYAGYPHKWAVEQEDLRTVDAAIARATSA